MHNNILHYFTCDFFIYCREKFLAAHIIPHIRKSDIATKSNNSENRSINITPMYAIHSAQLPIREETREITEEMLSAAKKIIVGFTQSRL